MHSATGPPEAPFDCDVHNQTALDLTVTCSAGFGGGLAQVFHLEVRDRESGELRLNETNSAPVFKIRYR